MNSLSFMSFFGRMSPTIYFLALMDLVLKGITLFKSAKRDQKVWFVALLLVNSLGILPIIYLIINKDIRLAEAKISPKKTIAKKSKRSKR